MQKTKAEERETGWIYDDRDSKWKPAWIATMRRLETIEFLKQVIFDSAAETFTSKSFEVMAFKEFMLMLDIDVAGTPTDVQFFVQFSHDNLIWFNYQNAQFGSLMYEDAAGDKKECMHGLCAAHWMRLYAVSSGCSAGNTFTVSAWAEVAG